MNICEATGKIQHDKVSAMKHAEGLRRKPGQKGAVQTYRCPDCGKWHVGHSQLRRKRYRR